MKLHPERLLLLLSLFVFLSTSCSRKKEFAIEGAPAPLFRDPVFDGAADPSVVFDKRTGHWLIFYTQRRAALELRGTEYCYGTAIGIAESQDNGKTWQYKGTAELPQPDDGLNTFWAPQVFQNPDDQSWHMIVSYIRGVYDNWGGERHIFHYASNDLNHWKQIPSSGLEGCIDASAVQMPDKTWKMWFKDEQRGSFTYTATGKDLKTWTRATHRNAEDSMYYTPEVNNRKHEAPIVFFWKEKWWMVTDPTYEEFTGLDIFSSSDASTWIYNSTILDKPGLRPDDNDQGRHADVQVVGDRAFLFYFTHPGRIYNKPGQSLPGLMSEDPDENRLRYRRSSLQVAELELTNGRIICNRDKFATLK